MAVLFVIDLPVTVKRSLDLDGNVDLVIRLVAVVVGDLMVVFWFLDGDEIVFLWDLSLLENISFSR